MTKISEYKVISDYGSDALSKKVMAAIRSGWEPIGGVSAFVNSSSGQTGQMFAQALVRYDSEQGSSSSL